METKKTESRQYLETWAELLAFARFTKICALTALFMACFVLFWALRVLHRPPMVIRVDSQGNPAITEFRRNQNITPQEIQNFVTYFTEYYTGWDYYAYDEQFTRCWKMMTPEFAQKADMELKQRDVVNQIQTERIKRKVKVNEVNIKTVDKKIVTVEVRGVRTEGTYNRPEQKQVIFSADLKLVIVPRTESLWGLLVDNFEEHLYNE